RSGSGSRRRAGYERVARSQRNSSSWARIRASRSAPGAVIGSGDGTEVDVGMMSKCVADRPVDLTERDRRRLRPLRDRAADRDDHEPVGLRRDREAAALAGAADDAAGGARERDDPLALAAAGAGTGPRRTTRSQRQLQPEGEPDGVPARADSGAGAGLGGAAVEEVE